MASAHNLLVPGSMPSPLQPTATPQAVPQSGDEESDLRRGSAWGWLRTAPAWLVSTLLHIALLLVLGLVTLADPAQIVNVLSAVSNADQGPEMEDFTIEAIDPGEMSEVEEFSEPIMDVSEPLEVVEAVPMEMDVATVEIDVSDVSGDLAPSGATLQSLTAMQMTPISGRSADMKKKLLREYGGNAASEAAVVEALKWLSAHQTPNGGWTFSHHLVCKGRCDHPGDPKRATAFSAATSMALLPFLGAGQTHYTGDFQQVVRRGLLFLVNNGRAGKKGGLPVLDLRGPKGNMYDHGLGAIVLCEAYAMTQDPALAGPAQAALNFIVYAQCRDGGWRYRPQDGTGGDTSVTGWQVMALKSGYMAHLIVPPSSFQGSMLFLDKVGSSKGDLYGYMKPTKKHTRANTAIGLLCRMYTGWDKEHPGIKAGVKHLVKAGVNKKNIYYDYYAAQVLRHYGGPEWDKFNVQMRDWLVATQSKEGGAKGSWI
ncbi:MAG: hypothetical protein AAGA03_13990, partial [Planctomycetota bacterium]